jgi:hypothetical protein
MRSIPSIVTLLAFAASPALAQGLPGLEKRVEQLEAQNTLQQQQIDNLQTQILNLSNAIPPDDGTAQALVGNWTGSVNSLQFRRAVRNVGGVLQFENFFTLFPAPPPPGGFTGNPSGPAFGFTVVQPQNSLPMTVQVNPEMWLGRADPVNSITFTIKRNGMALEGTGSAIADGQSIPFDLFGAVLSNNFFLLKLRVPGSNGTCAAAGGVLIIQGTGSLNPLTRRGMAFTGTFLDGDCSHTVFRAGLTKQ